MKKGFVRERKEMLIILEEDSEEIIVEDSESESARNTVGILIDT